MGERLKELREAIEQYFGLINEIRAGLKVRPEELQKPEALVLYEQCVQMGIPMVEGGIRDQPHIWLMEYAICSQETELWNAIQSRNQKQNAS